MKRDREGIKWRTAHKQEIVDDLREFMRHSDGRRSPQTLKLRRNALTVFCGSLKLRPSLIASKLGEKSPIEFKYKVEGDHEKENLEIKGVANDAYDLADAFVKYMLAFEFAPGSINDSYLPQLKVWLKFLKLEPRINDDEWEQRVQLPRRYTKAQDQIFDYDQFFRFLEKCDDRGKSLWLAKAACGARIQEILNVKIKDIDFNKHPAWIRIWNEHAKDKQGRISFLTDEAVKYLKLYLGKRINNLEEYVWGAGNNGEIATEPMSYGNACTVWETAVRKAGLDGKDSSGRLIYHIHTLRKFFKTKVRMAVSKDFAHILMGKKDTHYDRDDDEELAQVYLSKCTKVLKIINRENPQDEEERDDFHRTIGRLEAEKNLLHRRNERSEERITQLAQEIKQVKEADEQRYEHLAQAVDELLRPRATELITVVRLFQDAAKRGELPWASKDTIEYISEWASSKFWKRFGENVKGGNDLVSELGKALKAEYPNLDPRQKKKAIEWLAHTHRILYSKQS